MIVDFHSVLQVKIGQKTGELRKGSEMTLLSLDAKIENLKRTSHELCLIFQGKKFYLNRTTRSIGLGARPGSTL